jgi:hypothetical protein
MESNCFGCAKNLQNFFSQASFLTANRSNLVPQFPTSSLPTQSQSQAPQPQFSTAFQLPNLQSYAPQMRFANMFQMPRNYPF